MATRASSPDQATREIALPATPAAARELIQQLTVVLNFQ
jgi:hypothetical protein